MKQIYDESKMTFNERQSLRARFPLGFNSFQRVEVYTNKKGETLAVTIASSENQNPHTILTAKGEFWRTYANQMLPLEIVGVDEQYLHVVVHNKYLTQKRLHLTPFVA